MKKEYGINNKPNLNLARKRLGKETKIIDFEIAQKYQNIGIGKTYMIKTYGCQGNLSDSGKMAGILETLGFKRVEEEINADFILFNTCAIRENAENRIFGELGRIKKIKKQHPELIIGICGCMMQEEATIEKIQKKYEPPQNKG